MTTAAFLDFEETRPAVYRTEQPMFLVERITAVTFDGSALGVHMEVADRREPVRTMRVSGHAARQLVDRLEERLDEPGSQFGLLGDGPR